MVNPVLRFGEAAKLIQGMQLIHTIAGAIYTHISASVDTFPGTYTSLTKVVHDVATYLGDVDFEDLKNFFSTIQASLHTFIYPGFATAGLGVMLVQLYLQFSKSRKSLAGQPIPVRITPETARCPHCNGMNSDDGKNVYTKNNLPSKVGGKRPLENIDCSCHHKVIVISPNPSSQLRTDEDDVSDKKFEDNDGDDDNKDGDDDNKEEEEGNDDGDHDDDDDEDEDEDEDEDDDEDDDDDDDDDNDDDDDDDEDEDDDDRNKFAGIEILDLVSEDGKQNHYPEYFDRSMYSSKAELAESGENRFLKARETQRKEIP